MSSGELNYEQVGATAGELPKGFHHIRRQAVLGNGIETFRQAASQLLTWNLHRRAGLTVRADKDHALLGADVTVTLKIGPIKIAAPCRVVRIVDEPSRQGFAYGTLQGHPEQGRRASPWLSTSRA